MSECTIIASTWWNNTYADLGSALEDSLSRNGNGGMLVPLGLVNGTEAAPGLTFQTAPTSGLYWAAAQDIRMSVGSSDITRWTAGNFFQTSLDGGTTWKTPLYNNNGDQTFTGGLDFTAGKLTVAGRRVDVPLFSSSTSSGSFTTTSTSYTAVTNLSVGITATGNPVLVTLQQDGTGSTAEVTVYNTISASLDIFTLALSLDSGSTFIMPQAIRRDYLSSGSTINGVSVPVSAFQWWITPAAATTPTIKCYAKLVTGAGSPSGGVGHAVLSVIQY